MRAGLSDPFALVPAPAPVENKPGGVFALA
jgi:hypothetical protein